MELEKQKDGYKMTLWLEGKPDGKKAEIMIPHGPPGSKCCIYHDRENDKYFASDDESIAPPVDKDNPPPPEAKIIRLMSLTRKAQMTRQEPRPMNRHQRRTSESQLKRLQKQRHTASPGMLLAIDQEIQKIRRKLGGE